MMRVFTYGVRHGADEVAATLRLAVYRKATGIIPICGVYLRFYTSYLNGTRRYVLQACNTLDADIPHSTENMCGWLYTADRPFIGLGYLDENRGPWCLVVHRGVLICVAAHARDARRVLTLRGRARLALKRFAQDIGYA